jgi:hypothetical protein
MAQLRKLKAAVAAQEGYAQDTFSVPFVSRSGVKRQDPILAVALPEILHIQEPRLTWRSASNVCGPNEIAGGYGVPDRFVQRSTTMAYFFYPFLPHIQARSVLKLFASRSTVAGWHWQFLTPS